MTEQALKITREEIEGMFLITDDYYTKEKTEAIRALALQALDMQEKLNAADLRTNWHSFCDADPFDGADTFCERMEEAGFIELVAVTKAALDEAFAAERGIVKGGNMWVLTEKGLEVING